MEYELKDEEEPEVKEQMMDKIRQNDPFELRLKTIDGDQCTHNCRQGPPDPVGSADLRRRCEQFGFDGEGAERRDREYPVFGVAGGVHGVSPE